MKVLKKINFFINLRNTFLNMTQKLMKENRYILPH